jgi:hypothetical protein
MGREVDILGGFYSNLGLKNLLYTFIYIICNIGK